ncbi:MAG: hypothetical protein OXU50_07210 [Gammaproteobacteria bacterium]|nr:hypothetical protein [Gammaproteobacteria bacterium]
MEDSASSIISKATMPPPVNHPVFPFFHEAVMLVKYLQTAKNAGFSMGMIYQRLFAGALDFFFRVQFRFAA